MFAPKIRLSEHEAIVSDLRKKLVKAREDVCDRGASSVRAHDEVCKQIRVIEKLRSEIACLTEKRDALAKAVAGKDKVIARKNAEIEELKEQVSLVFTP